jgi:hypothetical protein
MRKVDEYRRHAAECRQLAGAASNPETRRQLLDMADTWDGLARDRQEQLARDERINALDKTDRTDEQQ